MDKMREEFEFAWQVKGMDDEGNLGNKPTRSKIDADRYAGDAAQFAWMWWKRSRESLVVGVPENQPHSRYEDDLERGYTMGYNEAVLHFKERLTKAGVNYK